MSNEQRELPTALNPFKVVSDFDPSGDQPKAIEALSDGINAGLKFQTLLGITGSGKSATMAWTCLLYTSDAADE